MISLPATNAARLELTAKQSPCAVADRGRIDPDDLPKGIDQRTAGIAGVERSIGLDDIVDQPAIIGPQRPPQRTDDPCRHRML
jgi:hypothetical protein